MKKWSVVVVDDEMEIAEYVGELVREVLGEEADVKILYSGTQALKYLQEHKADILLTDLVMPVTDGFKLLEYVADHELETEVILLTAYEEFNYIYRANKIKSCRYIVKAESEEIIKKEIVETADAVRVKKRAQATVEHARKQIAEVEQIFSEEKAKQMLTYEKDQGESESMIIEKIKIYIKEHIQEELTAAYIADQFHYSQAYLSRIFKEHGKEKLSNYILNQKMRKAKELLIQTDESVSEIGMKLGYQSSQAFARAFRRELSMTPQEYRRIYSTRVAADRK